MKAIAKYWEKLEENRVVCTLCPDLCKLYDGQVGACGVRINESGTLYTYTYGSLISANIDPVEKKPLFHFIPGHKTLTIATPGCNLHCKGCQNYEISQVNIKKQDKSFYIDTFIDPKKVVDIALQNGCKSISYSYSDPTIFIEYMLDVAKEAKKKGLKNIMVTALYIESPPLEDTFDFIDAYSIDLKFFDDKIYRTYSKGKLEPILKAIKSVYEAKKWLEITTLLVPTLLDENQLRAIARFIKNELSENVPWHISKFFPYYKALDLPPTPDYLLERAFEIGKEEGLNYIYVGNIWPNYKEDTICPNCKTVLIKREGYKVVKNIVKHSRCPNCEFYVPIIEI